MKTDDYVFTVIQDPQIPMSDTLATSYIGWAFLGLFVVVVVLLFLFYGIWYREHQRRVLQLDMDLKEYRLMRREEVSLLSVLHPFKLLELEKELEERLASYYLEGEIN